ncbi:uncharacterized protein LOC120508916 [Passer montanus]|uniref:uncharacterized protein LOC120508916 n=1 Tax=Passer montanus TaxID=9160 RepID=UPI00195F2C0C|nr:uncharacterized protein LOC120508916 [Passer montanus]
MASPARGSAHGARPPPRAQPERGGGRSVSPGTPPRWGGGCAGRSGPAAQPTRVCVCVRVRVSRRTPRAAHAAARWPGAPQTREGAAAAAALHQLRHRGRARPAAPAPGPPSAAARNKITSAAELTWRWGSRAARLRHGGARPGQRSPSGFLVCPLDISGAGLPLVPPVFTHNPSAKTSSQNLNCAATAAAFSELQAQAIFLLLGIVAFNEKKPEKLHSLGWWTGEYLNSRTMIQGLW